MKRFEMKIPRIDLLGMIGCDEPVIPISMPCCCPDSPKSAFSLDGAGRLINLKGTLQ